ncbi:pyridoxal-dependent decarboxylase, exosortase A system-associated [Pacificimonas flava]|uniref:Pyridoxal-dependent decarboxylase, exosortase A system-associated n=1 Tax=Pacificimonas flava TaxID=1234595 RepID=A0A219B9K7_9SPHN|nr:pyridoxal-dependent decarboxylase, exosortase A system-associated [Pacificimonas flava]
MFEADAAGSLLIGGRPAADLVEEAGGTPLFAYDRSVVETKIARLRAALPAEVQLHYAIKANPFAPLLSHIAARVDGLDVASGGELAMALETGTDPGDISFAGPGKGDDELDAAIAAGVTLNLESEGEMERALGIAAERGRQVRAAVRINPPFDLKGSGMKMGGGAKPFGVDAERVPAMARRLVAAGADFRGYHVFAGSQNLRAEAITEAQAAGISLIAELVRETGVDAPEANIGGGFGLPYFPGETPLDLDRVGADLGRLLEGRGKELAGTRFTVELGRYIAGECGVYLTRVIDRKSSDGQVFLITDGGLHHQLAASGNFGTVIRRNYPLAKASAFAAPAEETVNVVGRLCTPLDKLGEKVELPRAEPGDLIAVFMAGAYGRTASPEAFLGHPPAREIFV